MLSYLQMYGAELCCVYALHACIYTHTRQLDVSMHNVMRDFISLTSQACLRRFSKTFWKNVFILFLKDVLKNVCFATLLKMAFKNIFKSVLKFDVKKVFEKRFY